MLKKEQRDKWIKISTNKEIKREDMDKIIRYGDEIDKDKFMLAVSFKHNIIKQKYNNALGIDLNCGVGRHIVNMANLKTNEVINLGKNGPNKRKQYSMKRKKQKIIGNKEHRIMKDLDHKISNKIVDYASKNKLKIIMEDLSGIRNSARKNKGSREGNRFVNSWSFYRLQSFVEYKAKERGIEFMKVNPQYTSQECSYCEIIGQRDRKHFVCKNKHCESFNKQRNADVNAAFNVGKRSLCDGGSAWQKWMSRTGVNGVPGRFSKIKKTGTKIKQKTENKPNPTPRKSRKPYTLV